MLDLRVYFKVILCEAFPEIKKLMKIGLDWCFLQFQELMNNL